MIPVTIHGHRALSAAALWALFAGGCGASVGAPPEPSFGADAGVTSPDSPPESPPQPTGPDAGTAPESEARLVLTPATFEIGAGETIEMQAGSRSGGDDVAPVGPITWTTSNDAVAEIEEQTGERAVVRGVAAGHVTIIAKAGEKQATAAGTVTEMDVQTCCGAGIDNFCSNPPGTEGCPMTQPGGYCDPNGDASYTDGDWDRGWYEYQDVCGEATGGSSGGAGDDTSGCCAAAQQAADGEPDNICDAAPGTSGCAPTAAGGYCDPNGDASYTDGDWVRGYYDYQEMCP